MASRLDVRLDPERRKRLEEMARDRESPSPTWSAA